MTATTPRRLSRGGRGARWAPQPLAEQSPTLTVVLAVAEALGGPETVRDTEEALMSLGPREVLELARRRILAPARPAFPMINGIVLAEAVCGRYGTLDLEATSLGRLAESKYSPSGHGLRVYLAADGSRAITALDMLRLVIRSDERSAELLSPATGRGLIAMDPGRSGPVVRAVLSGARSANQLFLSDEVLDEILAAYTALSTADWLLADLGERAPEVPGGKGALLLAGLVPGLLEESGLGDTLTGYARELAARALELAARRPAESLAEAVSAMLGREAEGENDAVIPVPPLPRERWSAPGGAAGALRAGLLGMLKAVVEANPQEDGTVIAARILGVSGEQSENQIVSSAAESGYGYVARMASYDVLLASYIVKATFKMGYAALAAGKPLPPTTALMLAANYAHGGKVMTLKGRSYSLESYRNGSVRIASAAGGEHRLRWLPSSEYTPEEVKVLLGTSVYHSARLYRDRNLSLDQYVFVAARVDSLYVSVGEDEEWAVLKLPRPGVSYRRIAGKLAERAGSRSSRIRFVAISHGRRLAGKARWSVGLVRALARWSRWGGDLYVLLLVPLEGIDRVADLASIYTTVYYTQEFPVTPLTAVNSVEPSKHIRDPAEAYEAALRALADKQAWEMLFVDVEDGVLSMPAAFLLREPGGSATVAGSSDDIVMMEPFMKPRR